MAGKRKNRKSSSEENKISNACPETTEKKQKMLPSTNNSNVMKTNAGSELHLDPLGFPPKKISTIPKASLRRSSRRKISTAASGVESVVEHVIVVETEKEESSPCQKVNAPVTTEEILQDGAPQVQDADPEPSLNETILEKETPRSQHVCPLSPVHKRNSEAEEEEQQVHQVSALSLGNMRDMEEKVHYLVHSVDEFKTMITRTKDYSDSTDLSYKSLYIHSQKKIEALLQENNELIRQLEFARGKVEAYESMKNSFCSPKEVIVVSSLGQSTDAVSPRTWAAATRAVDATDNQRASPKQKNNGHDDPKPSPKLKQNRSHKKK